MIGEIIKKHVMLDPCKVKDFVDAATKCDFDVDVYYNRYVVDAKSILGVFGLDLTQPLTVEYRGHDQNFESFLDAIAV